MVIESLKEYEFNYMLAVNDKKKFNFKARKIRDVLGRKIECLQMHQEGISKFCSFVTHFSNSVSFCDAFQNMKNAASAFSETKMPLLGSSNSSKEVQMASNFLSETRKC